MKKILNYLPFIVVLIPQFLINNYIIILLFTILIGFLSFFTIERKRVFLKCFLFGIAVFTTVFLIYESRVDYVNGLLINLGLSRLFIYVVFPVFSALNTTILFFFGYKTAQLFFDKKSVTENSY